MRKSLLAVTLCVILTLCLLACTPNENGETTGSERSATLLVGFGREDVTPENSVPLTGYGNSGNRYSGEVMDPLYATCIAFTDGDGNTVLLFHTDTLYAPGAAKVRKVLLEKHGIPTKNVIVAATHNHSAPALGSSNSDIVEYEDILEDKMIAAAEAAMADRKPARMYTTSSTLENMNFVRHYRMSDGSVIGDNFGSPDGKEYVDHVRDADNEMQLVRFRREGGKDVVLVNWQVHPIRNSSSTSTHITADLIGAMRMALEPQMDCYMAYFTGASGNINPHSRISDENKWNNYMEQGMVMAQQAALACDSMTEQKVGTVQILSKEVEIQKGKTNVAVTTAAFSIGDVAFAVAPYEMFDTNGKFIKDNSPFEMTFVVTCANRNYSYIAAEWAYEYGGYEVSLARYTKGGAELLADGFVDVLSELHNSRNIGQNTASAENAEVALYYNLDQGAELTPDAQGIYTLRFLQGNQLKSLKVTDKTLADTLVQMAYAGLQLDGDTVTGVVAMQNMPYQRLVHNYNVQSVGGTTIKLSPFYPVAEEIILKLPKDMPAYDAVSGSATLGADTELQKYDQVSIIADAQGTPLYGYVIGRPAVPHEGLRYCEHCKKDVSWFDWISTTTLPVNDGHYLLTDHVAMTEVSRIVSAGQICLDLNGKIVTQTTFGTRIYQLDGPAILSIMDSVGDGTLIPTSANSESEARYGMIIITNNEDSVFNLYSGTLDASGATAQYGTAISQKNGTMNMYGGTILGGAAYGPGATVISAQGFFNMYGGRIVGGKCEATGYSVPVGGTAIRVIGTTTIYGGIIESGEHAVQGGVIRVCPEVTGTAKLVLKGGTITGGKAPKGGGIDVPFGSTVEISGNVKIIGNETGNLHLGWGATISIGEEGLGEEAQIGISMEKPGDFVRNAPDGVDVSKYFISDDSSKKVVQMEPGKWALQ